MSDGKDCSELIDQAIDELKDAKKHVKEGKIGKAESEICDALRHLEKAKLCLKREDPCNKCCQCTCHSPCACCCPKPPTPPNPPSAALTSKKYFAHASAGMVSGQNLIFAAMSFVDDQGNPISTFPSEYSYFNLYINGMIQLNGVSAVNSTLLMITGGALLDSGDPIFIEFVILS